MTGGWHGRRRIRFEGQDTSRGPLSGHPRRAVETRRPSRAIEAPVSPRRRKLRADDHFGISKVILVGFLVLLLSVPTVFIYRSINSPGQISGQLGWRPSALPGSPGGPSPSVTVELEDDIAEEYTETESKNAPPKSSAAPTPKIPKTGPGEWQAAKYTADSARDHGRTVRVRVRVEKNLPISADAAAKEAAAVLHDKRSWQESENVRFDFVGADEAADLTISIGTPDTTDKLCLPADTGGRLSCRNGNEVVLNANRWAIGAKAYGNDITNYRRYLINHEVGHYLGYGHETCVGRGERAPLMMQQTKGVGQCKPNPWPNP